MKKKIITISTIIIILVIILSSIYNFFNLKTIEKIIINYETRGGKQELLETFKEKTTLQCNWNLFKPEIAFVYHDIGRPDFKRDSLEIAFYNFQKENYLWGKWNFEYTGGTTVRNTTFSQLLKMVKEDCYQFQKNSEQENTSWVYMKYDREQEEFNRQQRKEKERKILEKIKNNPPKPISDEENKRIQEKIDKLLQEVIDEQ